MNDLGLTAIIHTLKMWQHYLIGSKFLLMSDNISLKYLFDQQNLNARHARWLYFLSEYDFEIKHIKGKENQVAYALIRHANLLFASNNYESDLENQNLSAENSDREYHFLKQKTVKNEQNQVKTYFSLNQQGLLLHKNRLYIPNITKIKLTFMNELH